jgi:hypothetical protein
MSTKERTTQIGRQEDADELFGYGVDAFSSFSFFYDQPALPVKHVTERKAC